MSKLRVGKPARPRDDLVVDSLDNEVNFRSKHPGFAGNDSPNPREDSLITKLRNSQEHYDEVREKRKQEYIR